MEVNLRQAIDRQQLLLKEANHRVNNGLQIVAAMLHLQSSHTENSNVRNELSSMPIVIVLAAQYHVLEGRASSVLFLSVIRSMFTIGVFIALTQ
jgi:two-component sensor histidine kinase